MRPKRNTKQRATILEVLRSLKSHPTAAELHALVRRQLPRISLGTVYRNLDTLAREGTIQKLLSGHSEARFDGDLSGHYHVRCADCGCVGDVPGLPSPSIDLIEICRTSGFEILGHRLEFVGLCPKCRRRRNSSSGRVSDPKVEVEVPADLRL